MTAYWFVLAAIFSAMYLFNGYVTASAQTKNIVNIVAIIGIFVLTLAAVTNVI